MADAAKFQWKWLLLSLLMYAVFYFLVLSVMHGGALSGVIATSAWAVAGVFVIGGIAGYISKGVTIWEPVAAALIVVALMYGLTESGVGLNTELPIGKPIITLIVIFVFAFAGAWLGERIQKAKMAKKAEPAAGE